MFCWQLLPPILQKELVIQSSAKGLDIALLCDGKLMEIHHEENGGEFLVGDMYLGRVKKVMPGLNAAFIDIGYPKDAFLHYHDLGPDVPTLLKFVEDTRLKRVHTHLLSAYQFASPIHKDGQMVDVYKTGDYIMVQIMKEPISTKGPRLTSALAIPGRYVILMPFANHVSVSKKISTHEERTRLKDLITNIKPKGFGVIVRTASENRTVSELDQDIKDLLAKWKDVYNNLRQQKRILHRESQKVELLLRDMFDDSFERITVDTPALLEELRGYVNGMAPQRKDVVRLYETRKNIPLFSELNINRQLQSLFGKIVNIGGGAYLIIEHTEAMHVIDVNSGSKRIKNHDQEETALKTNLEAAAEIARQLRLRDMGGIIVIDFIDMRQAQNRRRLMDEMIDQMADDRAKHTILPPSKFGLVQITRQRVRPENTQADKPVCPMCKGTGNAPPTLMVAEQIEMRMKEITKEKKGTLRLRVHPYLAAYLTKGWPSIRLRWMAMHKRIVLIDAQDDSSINHFEFL